MTQWNFGKDIDEWVSKVDKRLVALPKQAALEVARDVRVPVKEGGNMPVRKGNLRNSLVATLNDGPSANIHIDSDDDMMLADPSGTIAAVINGASPGNTLSLSFMVDYANEQERKHAFVRLTAQKWPQIVDTVVINVQRQYP